MKAFLFIFAVLLSVQVAVASDPTIGFHDPGDQGTPAVSSLRILAVMNADYLVGGNEFSVADDCVDSTGDHFHSNDGGAFGNGPDFMEVGNFSCEEVRGMVEFGLAEPLLPRFTADVNCSVFLEGGLFPGTNDFLTTFDIDVFSYNGNNTEELADFQITTTDFLGSMNTDDLEVGDEVSFDVTAAYSVALASTSSLGVRMQPASDPASGAITFEQCMLMVTGKVVDIDIKFCSNPNAFNTKQKGGLPVTIFGNGVNVYDINRDTLQLCLDAEGTDCTPVGIKSFSFADRGDPTTDLGAAQCAVVDNVEMDYLNPDGNDDLDAVFYAQEVAALIGSASKGDVVGPLYLIGYLNDATPITSVPVSLNSEGIDSLWIVK